MFLSLNLQAAGPEFVFKQVDAGNNLSQAWITAMTQDNLGFMWFGTQDGLYRYDGYEFKVYRSLTGDPTTLIGNNISAIFEDKKNNLWIATTKGLCLYNRNRDCFIQRDNWPRINISDITEDSQGRLYLGSYIGFYRFTPENENFEYYIDNYKSSEIYNGNQTFCITKGGRLLMNGDDGLYEFDGSENLIKPVFHGREFVSHEMTALIEDHVGNIWIGYRDYGLFYIKKGSFSSPCRLGIEANHFLNKGTILSIIESSDSVLWIGTENNGLVLLDLKDFIKSSTKITQLTSKTTDPYALTNNSIYSLHEDIQGNIWIGTYSGLNFYNPINNNFHHQRYIAEEVNSLNDNIINCFFEYGNEIWIGTEKGINIQNRLSGKYSYFTNNRSNPNSLSANAVFAIAKDPENNFWIGTWAGGLNKFNPRTGRFTRYLYDENNPNSISSNNVFSILIDKSGILWIGTMGGGLNKYEPKYNRFTKYTHDNSDSSSIANDWIRQVFIDSKGRMWVSTYNSLDFFDAKTEKFNHFYYNVDNPKGINDIGTINIFEDSKGHLWFGTESGLNLYHETDSSFVKYQVKDGLPGNTIQSILEDNEGNLWLGTNMGISKFINGSNIPDKPVFVNFDVRDGLQGNRFNSRAAYKTTDGCLYFGGKNGFNSFYPDQIAQNNFIPPVVLTSLKLFNKEITPVENSSVIANHISIADHIRLKYNQSVFSISFAALNYLIPEKNEYSYILEGFEKEWNNVGSNRTASYTNLDPGEYIFRVKASNNSGRINESGTSIKITILPPWYRTFWAYIMYALIISGIVLLYRRSVILRARLEHELDIQNLEKEKLSQISKLKTRFFTNISHEFRTPLSLIISPVENLLSDVSLKSKVLEQLNIIQKNSRRLLRLINQLMDISKIESDHMKLKVEKGDIVQYIGEIISLFKYLSNQNEIEFSFNTKTESFICYFDHDKIEKICYNLIANAFKYTPKGGKISVNLEIIEQFDSKKSEKFICIRVRDNGIGIAKENHSKIFEQFYRDGNNENLNVTGSGIGLSLVQGLINVYRGKIIVNSDTGRGSEFVVNIPCSEESFDSNEIISTDDRPKAVTLDIYDLEQDILHTEDELDQIPASENDDEKTSILLVEDNIELKSHLSEQFSNHYQVFTASNGSEAISMVHTHFPEVIISDIKMPVMDGLELCKRLKNDETTSHIPIILLTAKAANEDRYEGVSVGADAYITKPFDIKVLLATVKNLIESRRQLREKYRRSLVVGPSDIEIASVDEKFIEKAIAIVEKNISDPDFSVDTFSKEIGMSRSHLHRKLVGLTGFSPSGFIRTIRMKRAAKLLTKGKLTVSEILFEVGIKSRSYFTKSFKEQFGVAPTEYIDDSEVSES